MSFQSVHRALLQRVSGPKYRWLILALAGLLLLAVILGASSVSGLRARVAPAPAGTIQTDAAANAQDQLDTGVNGLGLGTDAGFQSTVWPIIALFLVLGVIYASFWGFRSLTQRGGRLVSGHPDLLRLQTTLRLGKDQTVHLVQFGPQLILVGASPAGIVVLAQMPTDGTPGSVKDFDQLLAKTLEDGQP